MKRVLVFARHFLPSNKTKSSNIFDFARMSSLPPAKRARRSQPSRRAKSKSPHLESGIPGVLDRNPLAKPPPLQSISHLIHDMVEDCVTSYKLEVLPNPIKSANDKKEYRTLQLANGIRVLLVSDTTLETSSIDQIDDDEDSSSGSDEEEDEQEGVEGACETLSKDGEESAEGEDLVADEVMEDIENLSTKKSAKTGEKMAAAGLCVNVGSFSDPNDIPGLAHFLEHMVFMGSEKYPKENAFDSFIKKHGGSSNASTDCERTIFHFEIQPKFFVEALEYFAQFFISPLLRCESMQREKEAVDSEFLMSLPSDYFRKQQLFASLANPGHPMGKFMWGNLATLTLSDDVEGAQLNARLKEFREKYYVAQRVTLVLQSKERLDALEQLAEKTFASVPAATVFEHSNTFSASEFANPFKNDRFTKIYKVVPIKDITQVEIRWALPSQLERYKVKPLHYVSWLVGHEGKGSLLSYLRKKIWALGLTCGNDESGFEHNGTYSHFSITVNLTEEGFDHVYEVLTVIFAYLAMLRQLGPQERVFKEIQSIEDMSFRYTEESGAAEYVQSLCENMCLYPPEDYITGDVLLFHYDAEIIAECQNALLPSQANIMLLSKKFSEQSICDQVEPWFQTPYAVEAIPEDWLNAWQDSKLDVSAFHVPHPNPYIASDFALLAPEPVSKFPEKVESGEKVTLWYRQDQTFKLPKAFYNFRLTTPLADESSTSYAMMDLLGGVLKQQLVEDIYDADVAQLEYSVFPNEKGLDVKTSGFHHKLPLLLKTIVEHIAAFDQNVREDVFAVIKTQTKKNYHNLLLKPDKVVRDIRLTILQETGHCSLLERRDALDNITFDSFLDFFRKLKDSLQVEGLIQGNVSLEQAQELCSMVRSLLKCESPSLPLRSTKVRQLPFGERHCRIASFHECDANSVVVNYYQSGPTDVRKTCIMEVLVMMMEEPVFDVLRTKEQLGYHVYTTLRYTFGILGFSIIVHFQADKFSPKHVDERIEAFLEQFGKQLENMNDSDLQTVVNSLIRMKEKPDVSLDEEVSRNWSEITSDEYVFNRHEQEVELLPQITLPEVKEFFHCHVAGGNRANFRKLSVQVVGSSSKEDKPSREKRTTLDDERPIVYTYLTELGQNTDFIKDIEQFKLSLETYPPFPSVQISV